MTRRFLRTFGRLLIGAVLWVQLAISAYACPGLAPDTPNTPNAPMLNCEDMMGTMDPALAPLCAEHCHPDPQSDHAPTLALPAVLFTALYATPPTPVPNTAADAAGAWRAAAPPHTLLHCCFRI